MKTVTYWIACLMLLPAFAFAQSEGTATFKMSMPGGGGAVTASQFRVSFGRTGARMDMQMDLSAMSGRRGGDRSPMPSTLTMTTIQRLSEPDRVYMINDAQKSYSVIDLSKTQQDASRSGETWTIQRGGRDTVAGIGCEKATLTSSKGSRVDACVASDLLTTASWWEALSRRQNMNDNWTRAMRDAGLKGFPIRMKFSAAASAGSGVEMELVSLEKKPVPASLFEIPTGYKETSIAGVMMSPEQLKRMNDALARLTPEQRKAYEDAMKKAQ